jgi:hypothetical protein
MTIYNPDQNNIFSLFFNTRLTSTLKDTPPEKGEPKSYSYTLEQATARYKEITGKESMPYFFTDKPQPDTYEFNNYAPGTYYQNDAVPELTFPLVRTFNSNAFKKNFAGVTTKEYTSSNPVTVTLNYQIITKGYNFSEGKQAQRIKNKKKLDEILNSGQVGPHKNNKELFDRLLKIMTFILARERGTAVGQNSSTELMQREYGIICWAIANATLRGKFKSNNNMLKLLQSVYSNPKNHVDKDNNTNDVTKEPEVSTMKTIYNSRVGNTNNNLQLFVMAFWDGYINEEFEGVTNWDHVTSYDDGKFVFREMHLPVSFKNTNDPDIGLQITFDILKDNEPDGKTTRPETVTIEDQSVIYNISNTSKADTYSLDGNVLFTIQ